jgi:membrane-bound serine protease (ClpP class)
MNRRIGRYKVTHIATGGGDVPSLVGLRAIDRPNRAVIPALFAVLMAFWLWTAISARAESQPVVVAQIKGAIGVGTGYYVTDALTFARRKNAQLLILKIDTPGGLVSATRDIIQSILASPTPVAVFVSPSGARAASAGTYIAYAAHVVAMAPGTHLGAATPIQMQLPGLPQGPRPNQPTPGSKDKKDGPTLVPAKSKMINDAVAYLRSLAQLRGRSEQWADKFVRDAATLTSTEALKEGVIDFVATDVRDLLAKLQDKSVNVEGGERVLDVRDADVKLIEPNWKVRFLTAITDPNIAFILLMIGVYGIIFEFWSPGLTGPGVVGGISLIVALMALSALPLSYAGLAMLALGIALMAAEAFAPGFGILGIGGIVAFIFGAIFLFDPAGADIDLSVAWPVIISTAITSALFLIGLLGLVIRSRRNPVVTGREELIGLEGEVISWDVRGGKVRVHGEVWTARAAKDLHSGAQIKITGREGLILIVEPHTQGTRP